MRVEVEDADGPPMPPPARSRRRRRRAVAAVVAIVVLGVPVSLTVAGAFTDSRGPQATGTDDAPASGDDGPDDGTPGQSGSEDGPPGDATPEDGTPGDGSPGDATPDPDGQLGTLDLDALDGAAAVYGRLLIDIDRSEQVMIGFQDEVATTFSQPGRSPQQLLETIQDIASGRRDALLEARARLDESLPDAGAESVRERYVAHLDSWADYMQAVSENPDVLAGEGVGAGYTVVINATADAFARSLETELPDDVDEEVRAYADALLDRGFRSLGQAPV